MAPLLEVDDLSKRFGGFVALDGVSLTVAPGERLGLIGPNGSGKSTLVNCLCGALHNESGTVRFDGTNVNGMTAHQRTRLGMARSFQLPRPFTTLSLVDNLRIPLIYSANVRRGSHFTAAEIEEILVVLFRLNEQGITIVLIEHIMRAVMSFSQRLVVLVSGKKIADGNPQDVIRDPEVERAYLGQ